MGRGAAVAAAVAVAVAGAVWCGAAEASYGCNRAPLGTSVAKKPGDNGFSINVSGNPQKYVPGEVYTVSLKGLREGYLAQRFMAFLVVVEPVDPPQDLFTPHSVGTFQLYGDALTMHSEDCPNAVTQTSSVSKTEVQVMWMAPPASSGCVRFRATVVETRDVWYMDDGELTKELCEERLNDEEEQPPVIHECCACDEAKYEVTFEGLWSRHTHPKDFPTNKWLIHFSDIIGASHSADYRFWEYGGWASEGLKNVAEWGSTRILESELKQHSEHIRTIIKARGLWPPNVNGKTFAVFRVDNRHHLMSLVSMLGPTPDWIVGVSALELCINTNCSWVGQRTLNLYPWDAGTDSGVTYESPNNPTIPRETIHRITNSYPNDPRSPFYDPNGRPMKPLARLTITRQRVYKKSCSDTSPITTLNESFEVSDPDADRPECRTTEWSQFTPCSVTCGKGLRQRSRTYLMPPKAQMMGCNRQLMEKEMCAGEERTCPGQDTPWQPAPTLEDRVCLTTDWSSWMPCSDTCGMGVRMRSRHYLDRMGRKRCNKQMVEKEKCIADVPQCEEQEEMIPAECQVTHWTDFSPCSVTCGQGVTVRTRSFLVPAASQDHCSLSLMDKKPCVGERSDCTYSAQEAQEVCTQPKEVGQCRGRFRHFYYDQQRQACMEFDYGGCKGNRNNFKTHDECRRTCEFTLGSGPHVPAGGAPEVSNLSSDNVNPLYPEATPSPWRDHRRRGNGGRGPDAVDCEMNPWGEWGPCSTTCGNGMRFRMRTVKVQPRSGGRRCPRKQMRKKKCKNPRCGSEIFGGLESRALHRDPLLAAPPTLSPPPPPYRPETPSPRHPYADHEYIAPALFNPPPGAPHDFTDYDHQGPTVDCEMSQWGPWSPCTHSCGPEALQQRLREVVREAEGSGAPCGDRLQRRYCNLPPCPAPRREADLWHGTPLWQP